MEEAPSADSPDEVYVQYLDYESDLRDDDRPHHAIEISRSADGEYTRAELTLAYSDTGRVRRRTAGKVSWLSRGSGHLYGARLLSRSEAELVLLKDLGISDHEIAEAGNCDEDDVQAALTTIRKKYRGAKRTVDKLESLDIVMEPYRGSPTTRS